jgi:hypothetical protein
MGRSRKKSLTSRLRNEDPHVACDVWLFTDEPFVNEMCLMVLVAIRHQVERELVFLAARANGVTTMDLGQYRQSVMTGRAGLIKKGGWKELSAKLNLDSFAEWGKSMETLRLLANCLKHGPWQEPEEELLKHLRLPTVSQLQPPFAGYMPLPESDAFREGLALSINLPKGKLLHHRREIRRPRERILGRCTTKYKPEPDHR